MGFAAVLRATGCDRHLVKLLLAPVRRVRWALVPGGILTAYLVNAAVPSQTSTAAAMGPILMPLLCAAGVPPVRAGAALLGGASSGGAGAPRGPQPPRARGGAAGVPPGPRPPRRAPAGGAGARAAPAAFPLLSRRARQEPAPAPPGLGGAGPGEEPLSVVKA